jgi:hypothetical protein
MSENIDEDESPALFKKTPNENRASVKGSMQNGMAASFDHRNTGVGVIVVNHPLETPLSLKSAVMFNSNNSHDFSNQTF